MTIVLLLLFGPSVLGLLSLLATCVFTDNLRWLVGVCAAAMLLHVVSVGVEYAAVAVSGAGGGGVPFDPALFGDHLIIGWAVIAVIALAKYGLVKHAQARR